MGRRFRLSTVLNVEDRLNHELDIAKVESAFESVAEAQSRNNALRKILSSGSEDQQRLGEVLAKCNHASAKPCRLSICNVCCRENRRIFVADGLRALNLTPDGNPSSGEHLFVSVIDHRWVCTWRDFDEFDMDKNGKHLVDRLKSADLGIQKFVGAWDFEWRRWVLNDDPPKILKFWVPHVHGIVKTSLPLSEFRQGFRNLFERKVIVSVERPTMVKPVTNPFGALSYVRKQIFGRRNLSELRPESRHQSPTALGPDKLQQLCMKLHGQGYKSRYILIGCRLEKGRIVATG